LLEVQQFQELQPQWYASWLWHALWELQDDVQGALEAQQPPVIQQQLWMELSLHIQRATQE